MRTMIWIVLVAASLGGCKSEETAMDTTDLCSLPSIGPSLAQDLRDLGFRTPEDLHGQDPEKMFADLCELRGQKIDRCVLYSFRCAVHAVAGDDQDPELAKWWNWKDRTL